MILDLIYVTYNSEKWVTRCFESLIECNYPSEKLNIIVVDNHSMDKTLESLYRIKNTIGKSFASFTVIESDRNLGFGVANNLGFTNGKAQYVCFLNIDTEVMEDTLEQVKYEIKQDESVGIWELRQFPYEHPKVYSPLSRETSWCSGAAFIMRREVFEQVGGFDKNIFLYAEDVDLSWKVRSQGYKLKYVPKAVIYHYSYSEKGRSKPSQYTNSIINNLNLRIKYGSVRQIIRGYYNFARLLLGTSYFEKSKQVLVKAMIRNTAKLGTFRISGREYRRKSFIPSFYNWEYEQMRDGAFYENELPNTSPLVSILIRTCGRYEFLREAVLSIENQTYKNIEIVIVEDGENTSEEKIKSEFMNLNIIYTSTGSKVGRSKVGNIAIELANGKYLNFLDDDDLLYPDHVEVLVSQLEKLDANIVYANAFEVEMNTGERFADGNLHEYKVVYAQAFNRIKLFYENYLPIQCVMFKKEILNEQIRLDESMDALEDWDFWLQLACKYRFEYVHKTTSIYRVPSDTSKRNERQAILNNALEKIRDKQKTYFTADSVSDVVNEIKELLNQNGIMKLKNKFPKLYKLYKLVKRKNK